MFKNTKVEALDFLKIMDELDKGFTHNSQWMNGDAVWKSHIMQLKMSFDELCELLYKQNISESNT